MSFEILAKIRKEVKNRVVREVKDGDLSIFHYTRKCMFGDLWNDVVLKCRGIIFNTKTGTVVAKSFQKFFNLNERPSTKIEYLSKKLDDGFYVTTKIDGSLILIYNYENEWRTTTKGTFNSEQAKIAQELLKKYDLSKIPTNVTLSCELISKSDRKGKVIDYGNKEELVLLTAYENKWEDVEVPFSKVQYWSEISKMPVVERKFLDKNNLFDYRVPENEEGVVIRFSDSQRIKIKSFKYLKAARVVSLLDIPNIIEYVKDNKIEYIIENIPINKRGLFDDLYALIMTTREGVKKELNLVWAQIKNISNRKEVAELFISYPDLKSILFLRLDNKSESDAVYKLVEKRLKSK